jgi:hypothetical protein
VAGYFIEHLLGAVVARVASGMIGEVDPMEYEVDTGTDSVVSSG